jgi:single stranded DNA-binding protein
MNKFILSGNLTADPVLTHGQDESKNRCNFRIAYNHNKDKATFFSCTAWGKTAERASKLKKGQRILVVGDIEENEWDNQGTKQRDKQVNVREIDYIDFPEQQPAPAAQPYAAAPAAQPYQAAPSAPYGAPPAPGGYGTPPAAPMSAPQPQFQTDPFGNTYQLVNGQWVLVRQAAPAPVPAAAPPAPGFGAPPQQPGLPFNGPSPF